MVCESAPRAWLLELDGLEAAVVPSVPEQSDPNTVVYENARTLADGLGQLAEAYGRAGIQAWRVWVPPADRQARRVLKRAGYELMHEPLAMWRRLEGIRRPAAATIEQWTGTGDPAVMAKIADRAFGFGTTFQRAYSRLPTDRAHIHLATIDGDPVSCVATSDTNDNCSVDMVATLPEARGRGISSALLGHALADAAERGCRSTTLLSSEMGRGIYERLGYAPFGLFEHWERRQPATNAPS